MARIVTLSCLALVLQGGWASAANPPAPAPSISAPAPLIIPAATTNAPAAKAPAAKTSAPANKTMPPAPPDPYTQYGRILTPSDDASHPLKLSTAFPGIGEMKVPSLDELNVREKLEKLASLSDGDIRTQLDRWPPFAKMKLGDQGQMLSRIQQFKDQRSKVAMDQARDLGLTLTPEQKVSFEKQYWDKRLQMERDLVKQFDPVIKAREQKMREELFRQYSTLGPAIPPPAPKPVIASGNPAKPTPPSTPATNNPVKP